MTYEFKVGDKLTDTRFGKQAEYLKGHHATVDMRVCNIDTGKFCYVLRVFHYAADSYSGDIQAVTAEDVESAYRLMATAA